MGMAPDATLLETTQRHHREGNVPASKSLPTGAAWEKEGKAKILGGEQQQQQQQQVCPARTVKEVLFHRRKMVSDTRGKNHLEPSSPWVPATDTSACLTKTTA